MADTEEPTTPRRGSQRMKDNDPCKIEATASFKCLEVNGYDREKCTIAFMAYKDCKKRWVCTETRGSPMLTYSMRRT